MAAQLCAYLVTRLGASRSSTQTRSAPDLCHRQLGEQPVHGTCTWHASHGHSSLHQTQLEQCLLHTTKCSYLARVWHMLHQSTRCTGQKLVTSCKQAENDTSVTKYSVCSLPHQVETGCITLYKGKITTAQYIRACSALMSSMPRHDKQQKQLQHHIPIKVPCTHILTYRAEVPAPQPLLPYHTAGNSSCCDQHQQPTCSRA
jgi:hypothetical protein